MCPLWRAVTAKRLKISLYVKFSIPLKKTGAPELHYSEFYSYLQNNDFFRETGYTHERSNETVEQT